MAFFSIPRAKRPSITSLKSFLSKGSSASRASSCWRARYWKVHNPARGVPEAGGESAGSGEHLLYADLRDYASDTRLAEKVFKSPQVEQWRNGTGRLHLFLDSLDESLLQIGNIGSVLLSELRDLPVERLNIRVACRTADWPATLEQGLIDLWGASNVGVHELATLTRKNVLDAATAKGIPNPNSFLEAVDGRSAASPQASQSRSSSF